jgi:TetR/AcrR family transcriptional repressor of nem operon
MEQAHSTKQRLLDAGMAMLLQHGYHDLGIQALLEATETPKGSFYHHFKDKEDFALQAIDEYMVHVHAGLDACLGDETLPPLKRVRRFFEQTQQGYKREGYLGCLLGGLGQELSGVSEVFRRKVERCFAEIARRLAGCLEEARKRGDIPSASDPRRMASLLVDCWEGAALRSRLRGDPAPLTAMLDFYFRQPSGAVTRRQANPLPEALASSTVHSAVAGASRGPMKVSDRGYRSSGLREATEDHHLEQSGTGEAESEGRRGVPQMRHHLPGRGRRRMG